MHTPESEQAALSTALPLGLGLAELERRLTKGLSLILSEEKATLEQWRALAAIAALQAPTMSELASDTGLPPATLTRTIDSLVDDALVFRLASKDDRRRTNVYLSEFGRLKLDRLNTMSEAWSESLTRDLGATQTSALTSAVSDALEILRS
ncbi:MAG: MarR family transcriptional regulator [Lacisediminihabitans sp.]